MLLEWWGGGWVLQHMKDIVLVEAVKNSIMIMIKFKKNHLQLDEEALD